MINIQFVDENDKPIGGGTKQEALANGIWHRIVRIFLINSKGEVLVQKRGKHVFSLPGRWDQSAAGHVDEGEGYLEAAYRELKEELGIEGIELREMGRFSREETDETQIKKRFNVVYSASFDGTIDFNKEEVSEVRWILPDDLQKWMDERPDDFTQGCIRSFREFVQVQSKN